MKCWGECGELELPYIADGNGKMVPPLWKSSAVSYKHPTLPHLSKRSENLCSHKNPHANVYSGFICNHLTL